ncbi:single-stranded-DNA-specific exonuclease RecJ [bacterium]|nr:single-stranded-DNA-specific exonuclease RecJ [candidate division CSSED10-310 bacterium]
MHHIQLPRNSWIYNPPDQSVSRFLSQALNLPGFVSDILLQRGFRDIESIQSFLSPRLEDLHDPFRMKDMDRAVDRICQALKNQEKILVCGDYDVDGITSVAMMKMCLPALGAEVFTYLPNRFRDGYGFHEISVDRAKTLNVSLLITVDCGISAVESVDYANRSGIDVIITDHHEPGEILPDAYAILNPKCADSAYPDNNLAGIGVAFKLIQALIERKILQFPVPQLLELVALGTVADVVHLTGENRIFVHFGLESLSHSSHVGLKALMKVAGITYGQQINPVAIGYQLGPRINAVGRLGIPNQALHLLLTRSPEKANRLADQLNQLNHQRQVIEEKILTHVIDQIRASELDKDNFIVVSGENWHEGVIGIVASKITEMYYRPACVISIKDGVGKGSGRSIPYFNLFDCLQKAGHLLIEFGGHQIAAGFRIDPKRIKEFRHACSEIARNQIHPEDLIPKIEIDTETSLPELSFESVKSLERLAPFGLGNPKPRLLIRNLRTRYPPRQVGADNAHLKLVLTQNHRSVNAIAFNFGKHIQDIQASSCMDVVATPEINIWNGRESIQLNIHDIQPIRI